MGERTETREEQGDEEQVPVRHHDEQSHSIGEPFQREAQIGGEVTQGAESSRTQPAALKNCFPMDDSMDRGPGTSTIMMDAIISPQTPFSSPPDNHTVVQREDG